MRSLVFVSFIFALAFSSPTCAQSPEVSQRIDEFMDSHYSGGYSAYVRDLYNKVYYPEVLKPEGITGSVYFQVRIDTLGQIASFEILRGIDPRLDRIVVEAFPNTEGKWLIKKDDAGSKIEYNFVDRVYFELR